MANALIGTGAGAAGNPANSLTFKVADTGFDPGELPELAKVKALPPRSDRNHNLAARLPLVQVPDGGGCLSKREDLVHCGFHTARFKESR